MTSLFVPGGDLHDLINRLVGKRKKYISPRGVYPFSIHVWWGEEGRNTLVPGGAIPIHIMFGGGRGRNALVCRGIIICHGSFMG